MKIKCFRCQTEIESPDEFNSDYITSSDTIVPESRQVLTAFKHNSITLEKKEKKEEIPDDLYTIVETFSAEAAFADPLTAKVKLDVRIVPVQKTGIVCHDCYKDSDTVIWGGHKEKS